MRPFIKLVNSYSIFYTSYSRLCVSDGHLAEKYSKANVMCIYVIEDFCSYFSVSLSLIHFPGLTLKGSLNDNWCQKMIILGKRFHIITINIKCKRCQPKKHLHFSLKPKLKDLHLMQFIKLRSTMPKCTHYTEYKLSYETY